MNQLTTTASGEDTRPVGMAARRIDMAQPCNFEAVWRDIFDRSRALDSARSELADVRTSRAAAASPQVPITSWAAQGRAGADIGMMWSERSLAVASDDGTPRRDGVSASGASSVVERAGTSSALPEASGRSKLAIVPLRRKEDVPGASQQRPSPEVGRLPAQESVTVTVEGEKVAIVVRDTDLTDREALHCGFETARRITGQRQGLHSLVLNGRIVYEQSDLSMMSTGSHLHARLRFVC
jgi:hypothetical protein